MLCCVFLLIMTVPVTLLNYLLLNVKVAIFCVDFILIIVEQVLKDGHVPPLPPNYIRRADMIKTIRKHLRKLRDSDSWVVIYGLPGFGAYYTHTQSLVLYTHTHTHLDFIINLFFMVIIM